MQKNKHILVFSHGFGVRKDDRGLLTDIATAFPEAESVLFDYFDVDEGKKTITICPLSSQAKMLNDTIKRVQGVSPGATIDLICHSQGTIVAALAKPEGVRKTILLAPVFDMSIERAMKRYGPLMKLDGVTELYPLDGYIRFVPPEYWAERGTLKPFAEYNAFAEKTDIIAIEANQDEIVPKMDLAALSPKVQIISLDGDHNFTGAAREPLKATLRGLLSTE
ncbi:MAG: hypothetical protein Q8P49_02205 [Candidatus Liptonbacteria bacterium]|nr:hypothetical protein [Candidatus Liptonbacteria bacterium]